MQHTVYGSGIGIIIKNNNRTDIAHSMSHDFGVGACLRAMQRGVGLSICTTLNPYAHPNLNPPAKLEVEIRDQSRICLIWQWKYDHTLAIIAKLCIERYWEVGGGLTAGNPLQIPYHVVHTNVIIAPNHSVRSTVGLFPTIRPFSGLLCIQLPSKTDKWKCMK